MSPPAVSVTGLVKRYGDLEAVRGIDLTIESGETFGFLGPNGAGKSTTISMLCTLVTPTARPRPGRRLRRRSASAATCGATSAWCSRTPRSTATSPPSATCACTPSSTACRAAGVEPRLRQVLDMVGLWDRRDSKVNTFSGGMKRRLEIARGLMHSPRVLFLDEPTVGLDPQTRSSIWSYIRELKQAEDITIFLTTHYMDEAEYCDRIAIMDHGQIIALDTPAALKASVGKDRVRSTPTTTPPRSRRWSAEFGLAGEVVEGAVTFSVESGEQFVPRLFAEFSQPIRSVNVARPTLDDVFMSYTGSTIRDAEATSAQRGREVMQMFRARSAPMTTTTEPTTAAGRSRPAGGQRPSAGAHVHQRAARDQDRLAARADPLLRRPAADRRPRSSSRSCSSSCSAAACRG